MTHFVADDESNGLLRAVWLAALAALLVALWGRPAGAVTLMEADVARVGGLCASPVQGMPREAGLAGLVALPAEVAGSEGAAPEWVEGELNDGTIVGLAASGMSVGLPALSLETVALEARPGDVAMSLRDVTAVPEDMDPLEQHPGAERALACGVSAAAHDAGRGEPSLGLDHLRWVALLAAPGLLAMLVAVSGIVLNLPDPED